MPDPALPAPLTRVLFANDKGAVVEQMTHCHNDGPACVRQLNLPTVDWKDATRWAALPAPDDARWRKYVKGFNEPAHGEDVLCYGRVWGSGDPSQRVYYVDAPNRDPYAFPGFAGGPMTTDWGVISWMPLADALRDAIDVPAEFLSKVTPGAWNHRMHKAAAEQEAENVALTVINDGTCYNRVIHPALRRIIDSARRVPPAERRKRIVAAARAGILYLVRTGDVERDMSVWWDAFKLAIVEVADYYEKHLEELA